MMQPWTLFICGAILVLGLIYPLYAGSRGRWPRLMTALKGLGTLVAAGMAYVGWLRLPDRASLLLTLGLVACGAADIVLNLHLPAGTAVFLAGHLLYLWTVLTLAPLQPASLALFVLLLLFVLVLFLPDLRGLGREKWLYIGYAAVQLFMLSAALLLPAATGTRGMAAATGAVLFAASDILLAKGFLTGKRRPYQVMGLYYTAQLVFSLVALQPWL